MIFTISGVVTEKSIFLFVSVSFKWPISSIPCIYNSVYSAQSQDGLKYNPIRVVILWLFPLCARHGIDFCMSVFTTL